MPVLKYGIHPRRSCLRASGDRMRNLSLPAVAGQAGDATTWPLTTSPCTSPPPIACCRCATRSANRPPVASLDRFLWTPHQGEHPAGERLRSPPTENRAWEALAMAGEPGTCLTVKGLERLHRPGPTSRAGITASGARWR